MKRITIFLILGLIALAIILPASAAGHGGNGKMFQSGGDLGQNFGTCPNPDCPQGDCPFNQTPPQDGTGMQYGKNLKR